MIILKSHEHKETWVRDLTSAISSPTFQT